MAKKLYYLQQGRSWISTKPQIVCTYKVLWTHIRKCEQIETIYYIELFEFSIIIFANDLLLNKIIKIQGH